MTDRSNIVGLALVAIGIALAGFLIGRGVTELRAGERTVSMRGLAERDVVADLATWTIATQATGSDLADVQRRSDADLTAVRAFLQGYGFGPQEVQPRGISVNQYTDNNPAFGPGGRLNITIRQRLQLRTTRVAEAQRAFAGQADLVRKGVALDSDAGGGIVYSFTKLNDVKPGMIAEATKNARAAAEQFATDSGAEVGAIQSANQGLFSIGARDGENAGSGTDSPNQKVRVVTTIDFALAD